MMAKKYQRKRIKLHVHSEFVKTLVSKEESMIDYAKKQKFDSDTINYVRKLTHLIEWLEIEWNFGELKSVVCFQIYRRHYGPEQPRIQTSVLGHWFVHSLVCLHCSLIHSRAHEKVND